MTPIELMIITAAISQGVPPSIMSGVCWVESKHQNVTLKNDGHSPSFGPCQIKLSTARMFEPRLRPQDLQKAHISSLYAAKYLRYLMDHTPSRDCAILRYNQGNTGLTNCSQTSYLRKVKGAIRDANSKNEVR
jgi:hypothetical protein